MSRENQPTNRHVLRIGRWLWVTMIGLALFWWVTHPDTFTPERIRGFLNRYQSSALLVYFLVSSVRACFLIPGTPFVLAGVLLFPTNQWLVFWISLAGVLIGSSVVYFFSDRLGFAELIEKKHARGLQRVRERMERHGVLIVIAWSFFPFVPTDLVCYLAGVIRMNFLRFIVAVAIGEAVLIAVYVFLVPTVANSWL